MVSLLIEILAQVPALGVTPGGGQISCDLSELSPNLFSTLVLLVIALFKLYLTLYQVLGPTERVW
jgi:hypothetical protein